MAELFWRGCKILRQDVRILPSHFTVTCYPYKEVHVTAKCDGNNLPSILHPRQSSPATAVYDEFSVAAFSLMLLYHKDELMSTLIGWCVALGGTTALDTLGSQAFTGATRKTDLGIHFQRCVLLLWILFIPVSILWAFMEPVSCRRWLRLVMVVLSHCLGSVFFFPLSFSSWVRSWFPFRPIGQDGTWGVKYIVLYLLHHVGLDIMNKAEGKTNTSPAMCANMYGTNCTLKI